MALPLLPTLAFAVIVSAASFLCQSPSAPAPEAVVETRVVQMESRPAQADARADATDASVAFVPAALAFRDQFPLREHLVMSAEAAPRRTAPRVAAKPTLRRPDAARSEVARIESGKSDAGKSESGKIDPVKADAARAPSAVAAKASSEPFTAQAEAAEDLLPDLALPFAPAISALSRAGSFVGAQSAVAGAKALALGNVVTGLVDRLPLQR
ncbi:hypothetical protein [Methylobacterium sp. 77]|uniref:hypothetical protein n=1 Tax=Methylobacterium sp. 77 TaxID=1101192 RepID=UPI0012DEBC3B|nr:hypothetical protein [Methylobacterium sp. 77]